MPGVFFLIVLPFVTSNQRRNGLHLGVHISSYSSLDTMSVTKSDTRMPGFIHKNRKCPFSPLIFIAYEYFSHINICFGDDRCCFSWSLISCYVAIRPQHTILTFFASQVFALYKLHLHLRPAKCLFRIQANTPYTLHWSRNMRKLSANMHFKWQVFVYFLRQMARNQCNESVCHIWRHNQGR